MAKAPVFELREISKDDLGIYIRDLRPSSSCEVDGLMLRLLKACGRSNLTPLLFLVNNSIRQRMLPHSWKIGCVTPLYIEGPPSDPSKYRPISVFISRKQQHQTKNVSPLMEDRLCHSIVHRRPSFRSFQI